MNPFRKPIRLLLLTALAVAAALAPTAGPAQAAPTKHTVTIMVTSIEVVDSLDWNACGEFLPVNMTADTVTTSPKGMNIIPKGAQVEYWNTGTWGHEGTFALCQGSTYSVAQTNLPELAAHWAGWNGTGLFAFEPVESKSLNRLTVQVLPGRTVTLESYFREEDPGATGAYVVGIREITPPAAGKNGTFTLSLDDRDANWGPETSLVFRGVISTSAAPTS